MSGSSQRQDVGSSNIDSLGLSSVSSCGSEKSIYQKKYEKEYEKAKKLEEKLAGYKTVAQQLPRCQEQIAQLRRQDSDKAKEVERLKREKAEKAKEVEELRKLLEQSQRKEDDGFTELTAVSSRRSTFSNTGSSPSFEIIEKPSSPNSARNRTSTPIDSPKTVSNSPPHRPDTSAAIQNVRSPNHTSIPTSPLHNKQGLNQPSTPRQQHDQRLPITLSQSGHHTHQSGTVKDNPSARKSSSNHSHGRELMRGVSAPAPVTRNSQTIPEGKQFVSYPVSGGPVRVVAIGISRPQWQMEQEALARAAEPAPAAITTSGQDTSTSEIDIFTSPSPTHAPPPNPAFAGPFDTEMNQSHGGARPKVWKPLNLNAAPSNPSQNEESLSAFHCPTLVKTLETRSFDPLATINVASSTSTSRANYNDLNGDTRMRTSQMQPLVDVSGSGDLLIFPSMHAGELTPQTQQNIIASPAQTLYSQQNGSVAVPSDDQSHLAVQAESMAAFLKGNGSSPGMSEMLFKFAEEAKAMEAKLQECQALIQRQQVQIQSFAKYGKSEDAERLREEIEILKEENATLLSFVHTQKEGLPLESGWVSVINNQTSTDPVRAHYPDSPIMKKLEHLEKINARLFLANKDWHNKWEILRQQHEAEKEELETRNQTLTSEVEKLKEEIDTLDKQLQETNASKQEHVKRKFALEEENLRLQRQIENLKSENTDLSRSLRRIDSELKSLKGSSRGRDKGQGGSKEQETEIALLKQQLTIFADDFDKERQDRAAAEGKVEKVRMERDQIKQVLEAKLKKISVQLRIQEDELRQKSRQNADMQYQIDDLKLKLKREQRHAALAAQHSYSYQPHPSTIQGTRSEPFPSSGARYHSNFAYPSQTNHPPVSNHYQSTGWSRQISPEHLPGAWQCRHCTYINFPNRTVCDICGYQNTNEENSGANEQTSGRQELQSRGEDKHNMEVSDVVVDSLK